jgi:hypothetical protein
MSLPKAFKTDESFLEKIAIGAIGTRRTFEDLASQGHDPMELERGSMNFKIWKAIKVKRVRVPDILCLRCGHRVESRAKTKMEVSMSHSTSNHERGWDFGLEDDDMVALAYCQKCGPGPLDWEASPFVQYIPVGSLRASWRAGKVLMQRPKGFGEGFEIRVTWPSAIAKHAGTVEEVNSDVVKYRRAADNRSVSVRLKRRGVVLEPQVPSGAPIQPNQIIASVVSVTNCFPCPGGAEVDRYLALLSSASLSDRYTAVKALGRFESKRVTAALTARVDDPKEHIYVRVDAAAGLMRRGLPVGKAFLAAALQDPYLENRLEAAIVLSEIGTKEAIELLIATLNDGGQHPEIRAGAAWSLGELGTREALPVLVRSFTAIEMPIRIEAARALAKLSRKHLDDVIKVLPRATSSERPGVAWALSKAENFTVSQLLGCLVDEDARQWVAYVIGTQDRERMLPEIELLAARDPQVYFAVTVLWKIIASWVYDLGEY